MKRILITGKNSYIGTSFENYLSKFPNKYYIETLDMRDENWRSFDFSKFDVVFHVAGIAHIKETKKNRNLYFKVNRDLAIETATYSKETGVKQFIFLSTMSVYGLDEGIIDVNTPTLPKNAYGKSKLEAEKEIYKLNDLRFKVAIIRPPMVYGKGCKGNYKILSQIARYFPFFPNIENSRSMIYIENLCSFIRICINENDSGIYHPQNQEFVCTSNLFVVIRKVNSYLTLQINGKLLTILFKKNKMFKKVFGNLTYGEKISDFEKKYNEINYLDSILLSENIK